MIAVMLIEGIKAKVGYRISVVHIIGHDGLCR